LRLLRVVNSAFFGYNQKIESLDQAVLALGTSQVRDLVLATTVAEKFEGLPGDLINMERFWQHSLACGVMARSLAQMAPGGEPRTVLPGRNAPRRGPSGECSSKMPEKCREIVARCQQLICFAFHDSHTLLQTCEEAEEQRKVVTLFYFD
ncbi:MAG: HDOD domain-containing protein, partial [Spirulinaceae cyanobacterium RM2_2_10]|nr:HDOD domain-containing protein [Spirulinaceae cyanobacterium RM2_2_10]